MSNAAPFQTAGSRACRPSADKRRRRNLMEQFAKPQHKAVARMTGFALTLGTAETYLDLRAVLQARLARHERAGLAMAALKSLPPDDALLTARAGLGIGDGPLPPFLDVMDDATTWAALASLREVEAYCLACFLTMPDARKADFLAFANRKEGWA